MIEGDQLLGKNALTINESNDFFITDPDLSFSTLLKLHKIRSELNSGAKELGMDCFSADDVISEALDHYADLKVID